MYLKRCALLLLVVLGAGCDSNKSHSVTEMNKGVAEYRSGNYAGAVEYLKAADRLWPENAQANYLLGQIYQHKYNEPDKALPFYDKATRLAPDRADYWYHKGSCLVAARRDADAVIALGEALDRQPEHADALFRLGVVQERGGELTKAAETYGRSIRADARKPFAYYHLGDLYFRHGKVSEASQVFKNGVQNNPASAELRHGLGVAYLGQKRSQDALVEFEEAVRLKPRYPSAMFNIGMAYHALGQRAKAMAYLKGFLSTAAPSENTARIAAAQARLMEMMEADRKAVP
jgi:tetratricopeptide (TPR) repeat protein